MSNKLSVAEHFYSIQGEGRFMGVPAVFLRLSGCNLMCGGQGTQFDGELHNGATWRCDTIDVWMKGNSTPIDQLVNDFKEFDYIEQLNNGAHLVITGGEPMLQENGMIDFLDALKKEVPNLFVEVETNGTIIPNIMLNARVHHYNVSPKLANSGNPYHTRHNQMASEYFATKSYKCTFKFVVGNSDEVQESINWIGEENIKGARNSIYLMPPCETIEEYNISAPIVAELCKKYCFNFSSRLQINLWNKTTGV
jgi:7-carboxy-7-deazaguanine synthase